MSSLRERFDAKWIPVPWTGCWLWTGATTTHHGLAYGIISVSEGKTKPAHRVGYELYIGLIPAGLEPDHKCRVTLCVNPWHLEPVTHKENCLRGRGVSAINAAKTHCSKGHPLTEDNLTRGTKARGVRGCRICIYTKGRGYYLHGARGEYKRRNETKEEYNARRKAEYRSRREERLNRISEEAATDAGIQFATAKL